MRNKYIRLPNVSLNSRRAGIKNICGENRRKTKGTTNLLNIITVNKWINKFEKSNNSNLHSQKKS